MKGAIEIRSVAELKPSSNGRLEGYAAVFNSQSRDLGGFTESIVPGAFKRTLAGNGNVLALYDHDRKSILGRTGAGTLELIEDRHGLAFSIDLPKTSLGNDLAELVKRGDVSGASFAFTVPKGGDKWTQENRSIRRELIDVNLHEITITPDPAYLDTTVAKRSIPNFHPRLSLAMKFMETL